MCEFASALLLVCWFIVCFTHVMNSGCKWRFRLHPIPENRQSVGMMKVSLGESGKTFWGHIMHAFRKHHVGGIRCFSLEAESQYTWSKQHFYFLFFTQKLLLVPLELYHFVQEHAIVFGCINLLILREVLVITQSRYRPGVSQTVPGI